MAYFLVSVSNKTNLELCIKYALAGFTNSINGLWTYEEIQEGDFISFLHGARVFNLYKVERKEAVKNANEVGPWPQITFSVSGKTYYFPFRLCLKPLREFTESMVRPEFAYVAENLLLRGGYRRTHFQADRTTLQWASQMGNPFDRPTEKFSNDECETFTPQLTWNKTLISPPEVFYFHELILQSLVKQWLSRNLQTLFNSSGLNRLQAEKFEVLGEKALPEGYVDILIKEAIPAGYSQKIIVEVKSSKPQPKDFIQLESYMKEMGKECIAGILIARDLPKKLNKMPNVICYTYSFGEIDLSEKYSTVDLRSRIRINRL